MNAYELIVNYVPHREDLASLCSVSTAFQLAAETALYSTLHIPLRDVDSTMSLCFILAHTSRLALRVNALTITVHSNDQSSYISDSDSVSDGHGNDDHASLPQDYWETISRALQCTTHLRYLNIHVEKLGEDAQKAWILSGCTFSLLHAFHCELAWDAYLISFLNQHPSVLGNLYLADYITPLSPNAPSYSPPPSLPPLNPHTMPALSILECAFTEAACALVPGRPVTHVKTCFSRERLRDKRIEMTALLESLRQSSLPLRALDLADASYTEDFTLEMLSQVVQALPELRYIGTLVLPTGRERLNFYGLLRRLQYLFAVELEVSDWDPPPDTPAAVCALAREIRLYCPTIRRFVFVLEFERTLVQTFKNKCFVDNTTNVEELWWGI